MKQARIVWLAGLAILFLAGVLRFANLEASPGWYTDEATHLEIVRHLLNGRMQYFAINQSVLLFSRLPLFELLLAGAVAVLGYSMMTLRLLTASLGVLSVGLLMVMVWRVSWDRWLVLLSGLMLAIFPQAILYSRFGFSYNLLVPLLLLMLLGMWSYGQTRLRRWLLLAALCLGLGLVSDLLMVAFVPVFVLFLLWCHRGYRLKSIAEIGNLLKQVGLAVGGLVLPLLLVVVGLLFMAPEAFWFDLEFVLFRVSLPLGAQVDLLQQNVWQLGRMGWLALGFVGLFWIRPFSFRGLLLAMLIIPFLILGRTASLYSLGFYYMIPFLPFFALGVAGLIRYGGEAVLVLFVGTRINADRADKKIKIHPISVHPRLLNGITFLLMGVLFLFSAGQTWQRVQNGWETDIDPFLLHSEDVRQTAVFLNNQLQANDMVIASPTVGFLLNGQVADFQMATAVHGINTPHLPADLPPDRFAFNPDFAQADIVVTDKLWDNWAQIHVPGVPEVMVELQTWPQIFQSGDVIVYQNPD